MSLQTPPLHLDLITDPRQREVFEQIDAVVRSILIHLRPLLKTTVDDGIVVAQRSRVEEVDEAPTTKSTQGAVGQLAKSGERLYLKIANEGANTDWVDIGGGSGLGISGVRQTTEPDATDSDAPWIWIQDRGAGVSDRLYMRMKKSDDTFDYIPILSAP